MRALAMVSVTLFGSFALACGAGSVGEKQNPNEYNGNKAAAAQMIAAKIVCSTESGLVQARLKEYAIYKCPNSPTTRILELPNKISMRVTNVTVTSLGDVETEKNVYEAVSDQMYQYTSDDYIVTNRDQTIICMDEADAVAKGIAIQPIGE